MNGVTADTQNLGITLFELSVRLTEESSLAGSTSGEVKNVKGQDDRFFAAVLAEGYLSVFGRR